MNLRALARGLLSLVLGAASCARPAPSPDKLVVGASALRISAPLFVAADRGLFTKHGLAVELRAYPTAQPMVDDVVLGRIDAAGYTAYPIVFHSAKGALRPPRMVTSLVEDKAHRLSYVLAKKGSGLRFPEGARGRRIGILPTVAYQRWIEAILRAGGLAPSEASVVPIAPPLEAPSLSAGAVDFLFTGDPMATAALASGVAELADDGPPCAARLGDPFYFGGFALSGALAEERPATAARLVAAVDEAIELLRADPAAGRAALAAHLRPEERALAELYPPSSYVRSSELAPGALPAEAARERKLGILDFDPTVAAWAPGPAR